MQKAGWFDRLLGRKDSAVANMYAIQGYGAPVWMDRDYKAFAREAYSQNVIAYRSIRLVAENAGACPLVLYDAAGKEVEKHPLQEVFSRPNPWQGWPELIDGLVSYLLLSGNGYLEAVMLDGGVRELYALRPDRMTAIAGKRGWPAAWDYSVDGSKKHRFEMDLPPTSQMPILHIKQFHPLDDWYGLSPVDPAAFSIDCHNASGAFNKALLDNASTPSGALVYKGDGEDSTLSDDQFKRLKAEMAERHQGAKNAGRPLLLDGGLEWVPMGMAPKDMEFGEGRAAAARDIALAFGVPPLLLGLPGDNTFANYKEANAAFARQTVLPLVGRIASALSNWLQPSYAGLRIGIDMDRVDALTIERSEIWNRVTGADFLTTDEQREAVGYGPYQPTGAPGGSIMANASEMPLEEAGFVPGGPAPE